VEAFLVRRCDGVSLGRRAGLIFALVSGEDSPLVDRFARKMGIQDVYKDCKDKAAALRLFAQNRGLELAEICFMGDDVNDLRPGSGRIQGRPADAHASVKRCVDLVTTRPGGGGAVRELVDRLLGERDGAERQP